MTQVIRQKLKNHFLLGFIPFGANCNDVLKPIIEDIKELENGFEMDLDNKRIWITGGLGNITSDLPEGNEQARIKNHNANHGCRICIIHHDELNNMSFDLAMGRRYHHKTSLQFVELDNAQTHGEREFLSQQYGIRNKPSIFDNVTCDRHLQCPHDVFHCMGGLASNILQETFSILMTKGEELFLTIWKCFEFPKLLKDQCVRNFLDNWYISPLQFDLESDSSLTCMTENYINLCVQSPLKKCDLKKDDLETFLNNDLFAETAEDERVKGDKEIEEDREITGKGVVKSKEVVNN
ncbi:hypothetical protein GLOIN_2v1847995 [Rhizophagus irregularis DAOM 181602=DAOM 197198]|uniref:Uncharacterized protein n=1 Tax=Rhizophagus irregularis (strain DAOM 181602 / DAOM 197198 / MUCL 43194) TaxID=747089 RepID=A0A2P4P2V5_RHIID|nr:hypothetical protein GLOIN_2v1847995 [Rhizophagus irregularis DAOM 181602=DAOM 197198]POG59717.1 hypothetical protein GLOIN_2v1847995 [Rhizophagus irregularis DAOM 181602=DAOM 197198]|eukprot:XP_025166583.1 hypothetical protein GLOIN_2v1847995 [Rhizophagus irregularis DAOM 181602=DAOM 197198]